MLYVIKDGKQIFADKTLVGTPRYATPVFTADMKTIVFNPDWTAPRGTEDLAPQREGPWRRNCTSGKLLNSRPIHPVRVQGKPIDPTRVIGRVNVRYSFTRMPDYGARKVKFLYPIGTCFMHDSAGRRKL